VSPRAACRTTATTVQLWDPDGLLVGQFDGSAQRLLFNADGQLLFGLDNGEVLRVWDVPRRSQLGTLQALPLVDHRCNQSAGGAEYGLRTRWVPDPTASSGLPPHQRGPPAGCSHLRRGTGLPAGGRADPSAPKNGSTTWAQAPLLPLTFPARTDLPRRTCRFWERNGSGA
jgi:hypothetical protein